MHYSTTFAAIWEKLNIRITVKYLINVSNLIPGLPAGKIDLKDCL